MPKTLLLQGPIGPFFAGLAQELRRRGDDVRHVVFNGGDRLFADRQAMVDYRGRPEDVDAWVLERCREWHIDRVILFGDCRPYHRAIHELLNQHHVPVWVFEEGYLRPVFLTFERHGVNAHTLLPKDPQFYTEGPKVPPMPPLRSFERVFSRRIVTCIAYYCGIALHRRRYPHYKHYRSVGLAREGLQWIRAGWRKLAYKRPDLQRFRQFSDKQFYLLPLQVRGDSQIMTHSRFEGMEQVIARSIAAFANGAPTASHLVIKHHPMDRGYTNYHKLITNLAARFGVADRVWYVHDINLPTLLKACRGVITVNSTVGLSALIQRKPVIVLGEALYNMPGLTFQGSLRDFWTASFAPDDNLAHRFVEYLRYWTQMNACSATKQANFALLDRLPEFRVQAVTGKVRVMKPKPIDPTSGSLGNQAHPALVPISSSSQPPTLASVHLLPSSHSEPQPRSSTTQQEVALAT